MERFVHLKVAVYMANSPGDCIDRLGLTIQASLDLAILWRVFTSPSLHSLSSGIGFRARGWHGKGARTTCPICQGGHAGVELDLGRFVGGAEDVKVVRHGGRM